MHIVSLLPIFICDKLSPNMEYQKAIAILTIMLDKYSLDAGEKEAVFTAIGLLSLGSLAKNKQKAQKAKRDKSTEW